jgi:hypothetical protein
VRAGHRISHVLFCKFYIRRRPIKASDELVMSGELALDWLETWLASSINIT